MADSRKYITHYVKYFTMQAPSFTTQVLVLFLLGAAAGGFAGVLIHMQSASNGLLQVVLSGVSSGVLVISLPALLTVAVIKSVKRKMLVKHAMLSTLLITAVYAILLFICTASFAFTKNATISYILLIVVNAGIYGYWLFVGKFIIGGLRKMALVAAAQPVLNILFYIPLGKYILNFQAPLNLTLVRLFSGMLVFLCVGYFFIYLIDRPSKRMLEASGINVMVSMVSQWLFNLSNDVSVLGQGAGAKRDLNIDVIAIKNGDGYRGIFVNPDIHFGPFHGSGGSVVPLSMGKMLADRFGATPFVLHSPVDIQDNPISTVQAYALTGEVERGIRKMTKFSTAYGNVAQGSDGVCRATNIGIGRAHLFLLTKAPQVTEDMTREVGMHLRDVAEESSGRNSVVVDAHNTRFESASADELNGVGMGSEYVGRYEKAIRSATARRWNRRLEFGAAHRRIARALGSPKDVGEGFTSVSIFKFGRRKFCMIYFDANNMLPGFREKLVAHVRSRFRMEVEVCTTDTHSLNTLSSTARMSLGRKTNVNSVIPLVDSLIKSAAANTRPATYAYKRMKIKDFSVWGEKAEMLIERTGAEVRRTVKYVGPFFVIFAFIVAAWVVYVV
ncbi:MAG: DUF2070 family protein [Candidatus Marsarchaeota archaeon]|nr:DUF2070 family protein [Candidatus Marsarchaeota archaeon]